MNSHLTAIARKALPVPVRWLLSQGMIHGHVLDFGCGKCKEFNDELPVTHPGIFCVDSYDPFYAPELFDTMAFPKMRWDVILCTYVLCTLKEEEQKPILKRIRSLLRPDGVAYITVRNDEPKGGYGVSSKGTFQRKVELPFLYELRKTHQYRIYSDGRDEPAPLAMKSLTAYTGYQDEHRHTVTGSTRTGNRKR